MCVCVKGGASLLRLTLKKAEQQMDGFQTLVSCLAASHAHLPLPDIGQWEMSEDLVVGQHLFQDLETCLTVERRGEKTAVSGIGESQSQHIFCITFIFSHLADALIQSDLQ